MNKEIQEIRKHVIKTRSKLYWSTILRIADNAGKDFLHLFKYVGMLIFEVLYVIFSILFCPVIWPIYRKYGVSKYIETVEDFYNNGYKIELNKMVKIKTSKRHIKFYVIDGVIYELYKYNNKPQQRIVYDASALLGKQNIDEMSKAQIQYLLLQIHSKNPGTPVKQGLKNG